MEIENAIPAIMFALVLVGVLSGYPLAFILGGLALTFGLLMWGPEVIPALFLRVFGVLKNYIFVAIPLFVFMGVMLDRAGSSERLFHAAHLLMGGLRGGLGIATIFVCTIFAAATGIVGASVVTMGLLALPPMLKRGYNKELASGCILAGGTLGILIPPSIMIVVYGPMANLSVARLFFGAFTPGLLLAGLYITYVAIRCFIQPELGPPMPVAERNAVPLPRKLYLAATGLVPPVFLIMAVLGMIFLGVAAPTEAAALGAFSAILLALAYRKLNWGSLKETVYTTVRITSMIMFVVVGASMFTSVFMGLGGGHFVHNLLLAAPFGRWGVLVMMMIIIFILGMFIDWIGIVLIIVPLFTPVAATLEFDAIWFALLVMVNLQMSYLTPPFAYAIFYLRGIAPPEVTIAHIYRGVIPFVLLQWTGLILCILFPQIILWLPNLMFGQ
jgi:tripartite ATP-independent transporter DctM subunit